MTDPTSTARLKVCAVSYLNTVPLIWGMLRGPQQGIFDLIERNPAECADLLASGEADIGLVPCFELVRQDLEIVPGLGIASRGPVRSILLVSKRPLAEIETLAADASSRSSVALARILLEQRYRVQPRIVSHLPDLQRMLDAADAALLIGDPALRVDPDQAAYEVHDLGREWTEWTGLPMVFAVWAGRRGTISPGVARVFHESARFGLDRREEIVEAESARRGLPADLVRRYITQHIAYELGRADYEGLEFYLRCAHPAASAAATVKRLCLTASEGV